MRASMRCSAFLHPRAAACSALQLALLLALLQHATAQWDMGYGGDYVPEYRAATVVTNVWIGAFALASTVFGILGMVVAIQWPNPRICCYKTPFSDLPGSTVRSCCSLYSLNVGFAVFWMLVFAIMAISRDVPRLVACLCFGLMHVLVVVALRNNFRRHGRPMYAATYMEEGGAATSHGPQDRPAVGVPMHEIPMTTVVIGGPANLPPPGMPPYGTSGNPGDPASCHPWYQGMAGNSSGLPTDPPQPQMFTAYYPPGPGGPPPPGMYAPYPGYMPGYVPYQVGGQPGSPVPAGVFYGPPPPAAGQGGWPAVAAGAAAEQVTGSPKAAAGGSAVAATVPAAQPQPQPAAAAAAVPSTGAAPAAAAPPTQPATSSISSSRAPGGGLPQQTATSTGQAGSSSSGAATTTSTTQTAAAAGGGGSAPSSKPPIQ